MNELVKIENNEIIVTDQEFVDEYIKYLKWRKDTELKDKEFKQMLEEKMAILGKNKISMGKLLITRKEATTRTTIDSKKLKEKLPEVWDEFAKTSPVSASISIAIID